MSTLPVLGVDRVLFSRAMSKTKYKVVAVDYYCQNSTWDTK